MRSVPRKGEPGSPVMSVFAVSGESSPDSLSDEDPPDSRPIRNGSLRDILDDEFQRCYRFEGFSDLLHEVKGFFKRVVTRDSDGELMNFEITAQERPVGEAGH